MPMRLGHVNRYSRLNPTLKQTELEALGSNSNTEGTSYGETTEDSAFIFNPDIPDNLSESDVKNKSRKVHTNWDPPFLRTWVLYGFVLLFTLVIVALQIIYSFSQSNDGISTTDDGKYYLWTYGPTAFFVIVSILWRQADYAAKSIQPWTELAKGPRLAQETLLLDYVTPFQIVAAYKALRNQHFAVFSTITVFFLIKIVTIISTGIFILLPVSDNYETSFMKFNTSFTDAVADFDSGTNVDSRLTYIVYGHKTYNVSLPAGTSDQYAVQLFAPADKIKNGTTSYTAEVDVFSAQLDCESGRLDYTTSFSLSNGNTPVAAFYDTSVVTSDCEIYGAVLDAPDWYFPQNDTTSRFGYYSTLQNATCQNLDPADPTRYRYMIAAAYSRGYSQNNNTLLNASNIICLPRYNVQKADVTIDVFGNVQSVDLSPNQGRMLSGITADNIMSGIIKSTKSATTLADPLGSDVTMDSFISVLSNDVAEFSPDQLLNPDFLRSRANITFGKLAAQLANTYLLSPAESNDLNVQGTITLYRNRLVARETPLRWMQGIAGAMVVLTLLVLWFRGRYVVPRSIDSITAVAAILARSPKLEQRLRGTGHMDLQAVRQKLDGHRYFTSVIASSTGRIFSIQSSEGHLSRVIDDESDHSDSNITKWTRPFVLRRIAIALTITASVAAIVILEVLLSVSDTNDGLANVNNDTVTRYSWLYLPILVFVLLGTLFNIMDFEIEFSESYHALSRGFCDARSSMLWYPLRNVSFHTSWNGLRHNRYALTAASASAILAPFLTIIVAGLFHTKAVPHSRAIDIKAMNFFNLSGFANYGNPLPALVIEGNMSYPQWTYDEFALPRLEPDFRDTNIQSSKGLLSVTTPSIRARVSCSAYPRNLITQTQIQYGGSVSINITTPDGCGNAGFIDQPYTYLQSSAPAPVNSSGYFGSTLAIPADGCPSIAIFYGHVTSNEVDAFTAIHCTQALERLDLNITLTVPDLGIARESPPIPDEDTVKFFSSYYTAFPSFQVLNITKADHTNTFDDIVNAMAYGRNGVPPSEMINETKLADAFTKVYRQYMAQVVATSFRANFSTFEQPLNSTVSVPPLTGTFTNTASLRLIQSALSTHVLTGVLMFLIICTVTIFVTIDMRHVLPKPVGSIAAVASLLAGSSIVDQNSGLVPDNAEWWSDAEWQRRGVWQGEMFRMGWWDRFGQPIDTWKGKFSGKDTVDTTSGWKMGVDINADMVEGTELATMNGIDRGRSASSSTLGVDNDATVRHRSHRMFRIDARSKIIA